VANQLARVGAVCSCGEVALSGAGDDDERPETQWVVLHSGEVACGALMVPKAPVWSTHQLTQRRVLVQ
jgi:hypothetical protein